MSSSTTSAFIPSQNRMYKRFALHQEITDLFIYVMDHEYDLPDSAIIEPLEGNARTNYGDYVFFGVLYASDVFIESDPFYFDIEGPVDIAQKVKNYIETRKSQMIKELFLHEAGILTFRIQGGWIAKRIKHMLTNGMDTWAPTFFDQKANAKVVFVFPTTTATNVADLIRSICIRDVLANIFLYSGVCVDWGDVNDLALSNARQHFIINEREIACRFQPDTPYFRVEGDINVAEDFYYDLATLWHGIHTQNADRIICMTPHRLREYIQQCHVAAINERFLAFKGILFCGFQAFSGEQQDMFRLWKEWKESKDSNDILEIIEGTEYSQNTFFEFACKFTCLKRLRVAECTFKFEDLSIDSEGNTFGYILHTLLLVRSRIMKSPGRGRGFKLNALSDGIERELGLQLVEFTDNVYRACVQFLPDIICDYLCDLSKLFNRYNDSLMVQAHSSNILPLCTATEAVMEKCCHLLGIHPSSTSNHGSEWQKTLQYFYRCKEPRPTDYHIIPIYKDARIARFEGLNSRFEIFSMNVRVDHSSFDKGSIYGDVLVIDTYLSRPDGWVSIDKNDNCFVSYFDREWDKPEHIKNDSFIPFGDPSCLHSIPFGSSIEVKVKVQATSDDKGQTYLLTNAEGVAPLSDFWSGGLNHTFGTLKYDGPDGRVYLNYGLIRDAVDTKFKLKLKNVSSVGATNVSGDIVAYYGEAALGDRGLTGHYYALIFRANPNNYIGLEEEDLPLVKSTLAVPVHSFLTIKARLTDVNSGAVIVDKIVEDLQTQDDEYTLELESNLGIFELKVNWLSRSSQIGSS